MTANERFELCELFQTARIALAGQRDDTAARLGWAAKRFSAAHPEYGVGRAYKMAFAAIQHDPR